MYEAFKLVLDAPDAARWLAYLRQQKPEIEPATLEAISNEIVATDAQTHHETPLYLRALSGIGAIISGFLILYLLYLFGLFELDQISLSVNGLVLMSVATLLYRSGLNSTGLKQDFLFQIGLTLLQAGKVSLISGLAMVAYDILDLGFAWPIVIILGLVAVLSFLLFPSSLERFVAASSFLISLWVCLLLDTSARWQGGMFTLLVIVHLFGIAAFLHWSILRRHVLALYDALLVSLCIGVGIIATFIKLTALGQVPQAVASFSLGLAGFSEKWPTQIALALALLALIFWVAGTGRSKLSEPLLAACAGVLVLTLISDPGILLALGLMILGYATHRPAHILLGLAFALGFGFYYYYALDLTLLQKSAILIASGLLFLAAAGYIRWRRWHVPQKARTNPRETNNA
ncbi:DUF4401 domain-containing protein [Cohaesibacter celericrescens]|uniref:DUF4401 domain-containing protein n=1 Tax=Cohaesibacter celericrescens TaxID=2067669 RepID=A0A2N5XKG7_9HYPH|nr:DUF4401 domain-containing protein [Cohaesibacter celericrescens]PLW74938.1 hypothetical protein C0081_21770 [Cohaesibacter celericrescens]